MIEQPVGDFEAMLQTFEAAAFPVFTDRAVWMQEAQRDAVPLPWPLRRDYSGYEGMLRLYARELVNLALVSAGAVLGWSEVPTDPMRREFQVVLRVVKRAVDAGDAAVLDRFGGAGRLGDKREWQNKVKAQLVDAAVRSGLPRAKALEILERLGLSRAAAYRAMTRSARR